MVLLLLLEDDDAVVTASSTSLFPFNQVAYAKYVLRIVQNAETLHKIEVHLYEREINGRREVLNATFVSSQLLLDAHTLQVDTLFLLFEDVQPLHLER